VCARVFSGRSSHGLIQNRNRLSFDLLIERRTDSFVEFSFVGINRAIAAVLTRQGITATRCDREPAYWTAP
jgi:hypothetical protein